ncbi:hypothetical protein [Polyangium mundeleinium]|uniref:Uncharacterized protein n=1 Tax=Polyangium mundeleinium TaxID=2995306 RepID=A0ABT5F7W0_9BACT|nr:hypothetical protein [Polyangium mundeleinium]MDC0749739.1 hypothetical protein [Polyangium mundeleinium]
MTRAVVGAPRIAQRVSAAVVGATVKWHWPESPLNWNTDVLAFTEAVRKAVENAYFYVISQPLLPDYDESVRDGHMARWVELWERVLATGKVDMLAAAFGYVIESLATLFYLGDPPSGYTKALQVAQGATRPDVVLQYGLKHAAWLDLTAEKSEGHIHAKAAGWKDVPYVAEILYPSMDTQVIRACSSKPYTPGVDPNVLAKQVEQAKALTAFRHGHWKRLGKKLQAVMKFPKVDESVRDATRSKYVRDVLVWYFGDGFKGIDEHGQASILEAMGISHKTCGFRSIPSTAQGESLLLQFDPKLPAEVPKKSVDRMELDDKVELVLGQPVDDDDYRWQAALPPTYVPPRIETTTYSEANPRRSGRTLVEKPEKRRSDLSRSRDKSKERRRAYSP